MTPRSRSALTRPRQGDGAMPTRSASALFAILASRAISCTMCRSMSSRSPGPPAPLTLTEPGPGGAAAGSGRTRFGWTPEVLDSDEVPAIMTAVYRILFTNLVSFPMKMHYVKSGTGSVWHKAVPEKASAPAQKGRYAMKVGIPREVKNHEYRVAITPGEVKTHGSRAAIPPAGVRELASHGHEVYLEKDAGVGSQLTDDAFTAAGAIIIPDADEVWGIADMVLKVKEPIAEEYHRMRPGLTLFTYLHLAADKACTDALLENKVTGIAYETVQLADGSLPLLAPMSEVAGRLAPQVGAYHLMRQGGGYGALLGGVPGPP